MTTKGETPLDDKLVQLLTRGAAAPVKLTNLAPNDARSLRHRLYRERRKMQRINHPDVHLANLISIKLSAAETHGLLDLIVYPANYHIDQALEQAGITSLEPPPLDD